MSSDDHKQGTDSLKNYPQVEHFDFEGDFIQKNIGCIPMVVRYKLDSVGIKMKLNEWSKFEVQERIILSTLPCTSDQQKIEYGQYVRQLIKEYTGHEATVMPVDGSPAWSDLQSIHHRLAMKAREFGWEISLEKWRELTSLQRFALMKLCRPGHENKNFPKAMLEFKMV